MRRLQCSQTRDMYHLPGEGCSIEELLTKNLKKGLRLLVGQRPQLAGVELSGPQWPDYGRWSRICPYFFRGNVRSKCRNIDAIGRIAHNVANVSISLIFDVPDAIP